MGTDGEIQQFRDNQLHDYLNSLSETVMVECYGCDEYIDEAETKDLIIKEFAMSKQTYCKQCQNIIFNEE